MNRCFLTFVFLAIFASEQNEVTAKPPIGIVNGTDAEEGEFPYVVQIHDRTGDFICGGSILASQWILTAGHCVGDLMFTGVKGSFIIYGTTKTHYRAEVARHNNIAINQTYLHPNFSRNSVGGMLIYDIGIIQLEQPIPFNESAQPIQLAEDNINIPVHVDGVLCGWGGYNHDADTPAYLQKITLQLLTDDECTKIINDAREDAFSSIHNLCTNDYYNGGCYGDAGSPYVINGTQYGLISWSLKPCYGIYPNTYSRITNPDYSNWIKSIING